MSRLNMITLLMFNSNIQSETLIYLVTEPVVPLEVHLKDDEAKSDMAISWGIHQIAVRFTDLLSILLYHDMHGCHQNL